MPLRPFPFQLGVGTDIVHVARIRTILEKVEGRPDHLDRFLRRFLLPVEQHDFYKVRERLIENQLDATSKHLAGRWAAKEAVIKAVSWRRLSFHDVMIRRSQHNNSVIAIILDESVTSGFKKSERPLVRQSDDSNERGIDVAARRDEDLPMPSRHDVLESTTAALRGEPLLADESNIRAVNLETSDETAEYDDSKIHGQIAKVSISHDGDYATAVCMAAEELARGDVGGEASARELL